MVQGKTVSIIILLISLLISIFTLVYVHYFLELNINDWIALVSLLLLGWIFMLSGLGEILKVLRHPKLKIVDSDVKVEKKGTEGEYKDVFFIIQNVGGEEAVGCDVWVEVENHNSYRLSGVPFSLVIDKKRPIHFQRVIKGNIKTSPLSENSPILDIGKVYDCRVRFYGNFRDKKIHQFKLDLSSWENIGIILDC